MINFDRLIFILKRPTGRFKFVDSDYYFALTFYTKNNKEHCITWRTAQDMMAKHLEKAKLSEKYTIHTLRHCFATHLLESGVDVCRIKQLMGHTHIQSTTFYLHLLHFDGTIKSPLDMLPKKRVRKTKTVAGND